MSSLINVTPMLYIKDNGIVGVSQLYSHYLVERLVVTVKASGTYTFSLVGFSKDLVIVDMFGGRMAVLNAKRHASLELAAGDTVRFCCPEDDVDSSLYRAMVMMMSCGL